MLHATQIFQTQKNYDSNITNFNLSNFHEHTPRILAFEFLQNLIFFNPMPANKAIFGQGVSGMDSK